MAEGAVDQGQGPSILVHGVSHRADVPCFQGAPLGGIRVQIPADSGTFPDTLVPSCAHSVHAGPVFN